MAINSFKSYKFIVFVILCVYVHLVISQENKNNNKGKVRIILVDFKQYRLKEDSCIMSIYQKENIVKKINLSEILLHKSEKNIFTDFYINAGTYIILIENLSHVPILFTNVSIKKNKMNYFPINFNELQSIKFFKSVIIKDYSENLQNYMDKNPPIVE